MDTNVNVHSRLWTRSTKHRFPKVKVAFVLIYSRVVFPEGDDVIVRNCAVSGDASCFLFSPHQRRKHLWCDGVFHLPSWSFSLTVGTSLTVIEGTSPTWSERRSTTGRTLQL